MPASILGCLQDSPNSIATVRDCPLPPGTSSKDTHGTADLLPLTLHGLSWQFPLEEHSHPSPAQASPPLAQQQPPASTSPACPPSSPPPAGHEAPRLLGTPSPSRPRGSQPPCCLFSPCKEPLE